MLEDYCNRLSDEAQLRIALRLGALALPVWDGFFQRSPEELEKLQALLQGAPRVSGGAATIDAQFPGRALDKIARSFEDAKKQSGPPIPRLKSDARLSPLLATSVQPLTNPAWDDTFPYGVRLVFTLVWNIATWILYRRKTDANETHIYVAINQAADVLLSEQILTIAQLEEILSEYQDEARNPQEDARWEAAPGVERAEGLTLDEVYRKIAGEKIVKDPAGEELAREILRQMREEGQTYWDEWEEYLTGTSKTYSYSKDEQQYWYAEIDVIVGGFIVEHPLTEDEMLAFLSGVSLQDLRDNGFEI